MTITFKTFLIESVKSAKNSKLAKRLGIPEHELSNMTDNEIHYLLKDVGNYDFAPDSEFDANQLKRGIAVEKEHTKSLLVAKLIAKDHLKGEFPDYYTRLDKMEQQAKADEKKNKS
jgi:hypothetical protein